MNYTAVIAEDEPILRAQLKAKLARIWPELRIVADVGDGEAALEAIDEHRPHLAFLDIQMPEMTGVDVARSLAANRDIRCHVVFVTAFDQYAVEAFDANAVDYVLKPYTDERLTAAVGRLQARLAMVPAPSQDLDALVAQISARLKPASEQLKWIKASVGTQRKIHAGGDPGAGNLDPYTDQGNPGWAGYQQVLADSPLHHRQRHCHRHRIA